jgi:hypothetical protein
MTEVLKEAVAAIHESRRALGWTEQNRMLDAHEAWRSLALHAGVGMDELRATLNTAIRDVTEHVVTRQIALEQGLEGLAQSAFLLGLYVGRRTR